jgi:hypothetical protein
MNRHIKLILISLLQIIWVFGGYTLRIKKYSEIFQSDFLIFWLPLILALILFGITFYCFYFRSFSKIKRIAISSILAAICAFISLSIAMLLGLNLYGS